MDTYLSRPPVTAPNLWGDSPLTAKELAARLTPVIHGWNPATFDDFLDLMKSARLPVAGQVDRHVVGGQWFNGRVRFFIELVDADDIEISTDPGPRGFRSIIASFQHTLPNPV